MQIKDSDRMKRLNWIHTLHIQLDNSLPALDNRQAAGGYIIEMITAWVAIQTNWGAESLDLTGTVEEIKQFEEAMIKAGEGILTLADLLLEQP